MTTLLELIDDFSRHHSALRNGLLISELFVTLLGSEATRTETKDKEGNVTIDVTRSKRSARFNVLHHRQSAAGLYISDTNGETAGLRIPKYGEKELRAGDSPPLLLSLPDALNEFNRFTPVSNADKPLTHLSQFIHLLALDLCSDTDLGDFQSTASRSISTTTAISSLDALGSLVPIGWLWSGDGFYDNHPGSWSTYPGVQLLPYTAFGANA